MSSLKEAIDFVEGLRESFNQVFQTIFQMELNIERYNPLKNVTLENENFEIEK